jgi:hypothetical protein
MVKRRCSAEETQLLFRSSDPAPWFTFEVAPLFDGPWSIVGLVSLAGLALMPFGVRYFRSQFEPVPISLTLSAQDRQVEVRWNHLSPIVREAVRGTIEILDGERLRSAVLSADDLSYGNIVYMGQSGDLQIRLEIENAKGQKTHEGVRFIEPFPFMKRNRRPVIIDAAESLHTETTPLFSKATPDEQTLADVNGSDKNTAVERAERTKSGSLRTEPAKVESTRSEGPKSRQTGPDSPSDAPSETYLQLAATSKLDAEITVHELRQKRFQSRMAEIPGKADTYRVLVGPVRDGNMRKLRIDLQDAGFPGNGAIIRTF